MTMSEDRDQRIVDAVIKKFGPTLDLRANPSVLIEILQQFAVEPSDGGLPGGVPPAPPPPDPCLVFGLGPNIDDLMRELLQLRRDVADLGARLPRRIG